MSTLVVKVKPDSPGTVNVRVFDVTSATPKFSWTGDATKEEPVNKSWNDLPPGDYAVSVKWSSGYQNINGGTEGNGIRANDMSLYYQVVGTPREGDVMASFPVHLV
jgi:uncharacterized protein (DUF2141 family)